MKNSKKNLSIAEKNLIAFYIELRFQLGKIEAFLQKNDYIDKDGIPYENFRNR